jgi:hypothetical protein
MCGFNLSFDKLSWNRKERAMARLKRQDIYDTAKTLSNWGRWGDDDQIGTLNNITADDIVAAAGLIKRARRFPLALI